MIQIKHTTQNVYRQLQPEERGQIQVLYEQHHSEHAIAKAIHVSTISHEITRGTVQQRDANYQYYTRYFAGSGQINYQKHRANCHGKGLLKRCRLFFEMLTAALKQWPRVYSVDSLVHYFHQRHPDLPVPLNAHSLSVYWSWLAANQECGSTEEAAPTGETPRPTPYASES